MPIRRPAAPKPCCCSSKGLSSLPWIGRPWRRCSRRLPRRRSLLEEKRLRQPAWLFDARAVAVAVAVAVAEGFARSELPPLRAPRACACGWWGMARGRRPSADEGWCPPQEKGGVGRLPAAGALSQIRETTEALGCSTGALWADRCWIGLATVMPDVQGLPRQPDSAPPLRLLDRQGWSTLVAGSLLLLISFNTNYGNDKLFHLGILPVPVQGEMGLHLAALAALAGVSQLAPRLRHRVANEAARAERTREQEAYEAARDREQAARRTRIQS